MVLPSTAGWRWSWRGRSVSSLRRTWRFRTAAALPGKASGSLCSLFPWASISMVRSWPSPACGDPFWSPTRCGRWRRARGPPSTVRPHRQTIVLTLETPLTPHPHLIKATLLFPDWFCQTVPQVGLRLALLHMHWLFLHLYRRRRRIGDWCPLIQISPFQPPLTPSSPFSTQPSTAARTPLHGCPSGLWRTCWALRRKACHGLYRELEAVGDAGSSSSSRGRSRERGRPTWSGWGPATWGTRVLTTCSRI